MEAIQHELASRILLVDDDEPFRLRLQRALEKRGYTVYLASDSASARELLGEIPIDAAVVDLRMPGEHGLALLPELRSHYPEIKILVLTGYGSIATALEAVRLGAVHYLTKPADTDQILSALNLTEQTAEPIQVEVPSLSRVEWEHIQRVLQDCDGNITQAAKVLGIHRRSLQRKLSKQP